MAPTPLPRQFPPAPACPAATRLGWIGTGVMGRSMVGHLLEAGFAVTLFTRSRAKAEDLLARGACWADSPAAVARASDVVFVMVGNPDDVRDCVLGPDGVLSALRPGGILVDHTTSSPELAREIDAAAYGRGVWSLDAPVSGGDKGAREGTLTVMVGGDGKVLDSLAACMAAVAANVVPCGGPGNGQQTKLVNQITVASASARPCSMPMLPDSIWRPRCGPSRPALPGAGRFPISRRGSCVAILPLGS